MSAVVDAFVVHRLLAENRRYVIAHAHRAERLNARAHQRQRRGKRGARGLRRVLADHSLAGDVHDHRVARVHRRRSLRVVLRCGCARDKVAEEREIRMGLQPSRRHRGNVCLQPYLRSSPSARRQRSSGQDRHFRSEPRARPTAAVTLAGGQLSEGESPNDQAGHAQHDGEHR